MPAIEEKMMSVHSSKPCRECLRRTFGNSVHHRRLELGLSVQRAARRAGLSAARWLAMENADWVPENDSTLTAITRALDANTLQVSFVAFMSREAMQ
jgi:hypothetical protein